MLSIAGSNSSSGGSAIAEPEIGWRAVVQLVAAVALVVPVAVAMPRLELPELFAGPESKAASTVATSATSQSVAPGETPSGLTAAEWADIQAQIAAATAPVATPTDPAAPVEAPALVTAPAFGLEIPDLSMIAQPEVRLPGAASVSTNFSGESIAIEGMAASAVIETVGINGIDTDASAATVGERVVLERGAVTEWFQVTPAGLEQGWTVHVPIGEQIRLDVAVTDAVPRFVDDTTARLERADGSALWYRGLHAFDADGASLPAHLHVDDQTISIHVDPSGATYPITIDPIISEDQRLDGGLAGDLFGTSVDVQGNTLVVGAPNTSRPTGSGAAVVFVRSDASEDWGFSTTLTAPDDSSVEGFGDAVALLGNRIAVGASDRFGGSDSAGVVQIFERVPDTTNWSAQSNLLTGTSVGDQFGASLAWLNADQLVIGAPGTGAVSPGEGDGAVSLATWTGEVWEIADFELGLIPPSAGDELGYSVAAGTTATGAFVVAGIPGSDNAGNDAGGIYVWHTDVGLVSSVVPTTLTGDINFLTGERAGSSVAFDRDRIAVGGLGLQGDGDPLAAHVFDIVDPDTVPASWTEYWSLVGEVSGTYARRSNDFVDLVGGNLAFGRPGGGGRVGILRDDGIGFGTAAADFFEHSGRVVGDAAGFGVAFDGRTLVMGAPLADTGASVDTGATFALEFPQMVHTFTGQSPAVDWSSGENWDLGGAPGAGDTALLPTRASDVFASDAIDIRRLIVRSGLTLTPGTILTVGNNAGGTNIVGPDATLSVIDDAILNLEDDTVLASGGLIDINPPAESPPGEVRLAPGASLSGTGAVANGGELVAMGGGSRSLFDFDYSGFGVLDATNGSFLIDSDNFDYGGTVRIGPGETIQVIGDLTLADTTKLELDLDATGANPPVLRTDSIFRPNGEIRATFTAGLPADDVVYTVIECGECRGFDATSGQFDAIDTRPLDVVQNATTFQLATLADKTISPAPDRLEFGVDVDVDGDWAIVGERNGGLPGGQAHVFERVGAAWELRQTFQASDDVGTVYDGVGFGADVAIVGNHAIVTSNGLGRLYQYVRTSPAAPFALAGVNSTSPFRDMDLAAAPAGGAYLIRAAGSVTVRTIAADGSSASGGAPSGELLPLSPTLGNAAAISATAGGARAVIADATNGEVFVLDSPDLSTWSLTATLTGPEGPANEFGYDVAIDGDVVVVAERLNDNPAGDIGAVWVYGWNGAMFDAPQKLTGSDSEGSDLFGSSVDLDGSRLVVGAATAQKPSFPLRDGEVYTFESLDGSWVETDLYRAPDGYDQERLGDSVAISGTTIIAAAHRDTNANGPAAGAIYTTTAAPLSSTAVVAIDGEWAAVGVPLDRAVYLVRRVDGVWTDVQTFTDFEISDIALETPYLAIGSASINEVTVYEQAVDDTFEFVGTIAGATDSEYGTRLDIADGRMAVGAPGNDELGTDAGIVIVYDLTTPPISARVATVNSGAAGDAPSPGDRFGAALALTSADLWIGAPGDDGLAPAVSNVGAVRRYSSDGIYADLTLRLAGTPDAGFGSSVDAIPGRAAIGTATSTSVTIFDVGTADSTIDGASTGFGNALAFAGDQLAVFDGGFSTVDIWSDDGQDGTFESAGIGLPTTDIGDDRHLDADGGRAIRGRVASGTTGWADAADIDEIITGEPGRLLPTVGSTGDEFGSNVAVDGDTLVVTAARFDAPGQRDAGAAYVFERIGGAWTETQRITGAAGAVAVLGDAMVLARAGSVSIFDRPGLGSPFVEVGSRALPTTPRDLEINGDVLIAGVPGDLSSEGTVVTVDGGPDTWAAGPAQTFGSSSDRIGVTDRFGTSVAASGNRIVVGAPLSASFVAPPGLPGYAEVWERPDDTSPFAVVQQVTGIEGNDFFGWSVGIENDRFVVGAPRVGTGVVLVYDAGENTPDALIGDGSNNSFGFHIDLSDRVLAVGDFSDTTRTYDMTSTVPTLISSLTNPSFEPGDNTAGSTPIATSGGTVISGARLEDVQGYNAGAVYTFEVAVPPAVIPGLIVAPDGAAGDFFGQSVSIHENVMAVGARFGDGAVTDSGAVYIFEREEDGANWAFTTKIVADDGQANDWFGFSVALAGSTVDIDDDRGNMVLAVGAPLADGGQGAAYLYRYDLLDPVTWLQTERFGPQIADQSFGTSVALEQRSMAYRNGGFDLIIGAPALDRTAPGAAYAYRYIVTENPVLSSTLTFLDRVEGVSNGDYFGRDVSIDGKTVVVGAAFEIVDPGVPTSPDAGALHVYQLDAGGAFTDDQRLTQPPGDSTAGDGFGSAVSIDHDVIVAGAFFDSTGPTTGAVYVSELVGTTWSAPTELNSSLENGITQVGVDVWVQNGIIALSSFSGGALDSGFVTLFDRTSGAWAERQSIEWPRAAMSTGMGVGLALSESGELAIGFADESFGLSQAGAVYVVQVDMIEAGNQILPPGDGDRRFFGSGLDADGDWMIVGEPEEGAGLYGPGRAHMFRRDGDAWVYSTELVDPDGVTPNDRYARRVALDGRWAAITDLGNAVHVFRYDGESWQPTGSIPISDPQDGFSLAVDGDNNRLIIGRAEASQPGSAAIYDLEPSGSHSANTVITPADIIGADRFGSRVAISGDRAFVSASSDASASGLASAGSVRVFTRSATTWTQSGVLTDGAGVNNGRFGGALDADGTQLIVGSVGGSAATIFDLSSVTIRSQRISAPVGASQFGIDVGIDANNAVVGARYGLSDDVPAGTAYVYERTASWQPVHTLTATDREFADNFGEAVDVTGTSVLVGASHDDNDSGVYAGSAWTFSVEPPPTIQLAFDLAEATNEVPVAPAGIAAADFVPEAVEGTNASTIAASPLSSIELEGTPLSSITVENTPLSSIALDPNSVIGRLSLISVDIDGGWQQILAASSTLSKLPLQQITLAQAFADTDVAGTLASTPLSSIDVNGTPLSSIPLSSIVLAEVPLSSIPLSSIDGTAVDWCDLVLPYVPAGTTCAEIEQLTLIEATLAGTPLSSIPLSSIPLSSIPLSSIEVADTPLSSIDFAATPLSSIPLSSIPLSSIGVEGSPLSSIPLSSIPLSAIPLSSIPLSSIPLSSISSTATLANTPLSSIEIGDTPLSSIPLSSIPLSSIPLSSIEVEAAPLSSIPLSSILLGPLPLSSIPLSSIDNDQAWCDLLADVGDGIDCDQGIDPASTTLTEVLVRGVPLSSIPLSSIPLSSIPLSSIPLSSIPLSSIPLSSIPLSSISLSSIPLSSITLSGTPLSSIPLSSIDVAGSPLSSIPLSSIDIATSPLSSIPLSSIPLSSIPLSSIPLSSIMLSGTPLSSIPLSSIDIVGSPLSSIPLSSIPLSSIDIDCNATDCELDSLGDAVVAGAIDSATTIGALDEAFGGLRIGDLADALINYSSADVRAAVDGLGDLTQLTTLDDLTLGEIAGALALAPLLQLGNLEAALSDVSFADLAGALIDPATGDPLEKGIVEGTLRTEVDAYASSSIPALTVRDLDAVGDSTLGELLAGNNAVTLADVWPVLSFISVDAFFDATGVNVDLAGRTLADVDPSELGTLVLLALFGNDTLFDTLSLGELLIDLDAQGALEGFTLADLLLALVGAGDLPFGGFDFTDVDVGELPESTVAGVTFEAMFEMGSTTSRTVELTIDLPASASYLPGTGTIASSSVTTAVQLLEPKIGENTLTWTVPAAPGVTFTVGFDIRPTLQLGSTALIARARVHGTDVHAKSFASVRVVEGLEPNDTPATAVQAVTDTIYLTYISTATDVDVFQVPIADNDVLALELSNLSEDFDVALWYRPAPDVASTGGPLTNVSSEAPVFPITDPDQTGADAEPLEDFPRLDDIDPALQLVDISNSAGTESETIVTDRLPAGDYFIEVYGRNGVISRDPAALQVQVQAAEAKPECVNTDVDISVASGPTFSPVGSTANTLFLVNEQRLEQLYGATERADLLTKLGEITAFLQANPTLGIDPAVVSIDGFSSVRDAYSAWDADSCNPEAANAVVSAINAIAVDPLRDQLTHVVIVGGDDVIPMARLEDATAVANEYDYRHEFDGDIAGANPDGANAFTSVAWDRHFLSDDPYGESAARSLGNRYLYVTDVALGRLVESPAEIVQSLDRFIQYQGSLDVQSATVLGYDFLVDGSEEIAAELAGAGLTVDDEFADGEDANGEPWGRADAEQALVDAGNNELISLNAHFDHYRALPAEGDKVVGFDDNLITTEVELLVGADGFEQSLLFSMGCHSGLAVPNGSITSTNQDWAEAISRIGGIYVANTGFGYGDTEAVAYTERLMSRFAEFVASPVFGVGVAPTTVGQALMFAKNDYVATLGTMSVYDEKALMESTFYGLPFYQVGLDPAPLPTPPDTATAPDADGNSTAPVAIDATNELRDTDSGDYYTNVDADGHDQTIVAPGRPIQPSTTIDVSVVDDSDPTRLDEVAHGAIVVGMTSTFISLTDPVVATPIFDASSQQPEPSLGDVNFPARPLTISTTTGPAGRRQTMVAATGQYRSAERIQRLDDDLDVVVYYADPTVTDFVRPRISEVNATFVDGLLSVTLRAADAAGVDRVHLLVAPDPQLGQTVDWIGVDLGQAGDVWSGSVDLGAGVNRAEFIVQAKDSNGNVGVSTNKATNFSRDKQPAAQNPPSPSLKVVVATDNLDAASGWYTGDVVVRVESDSPATFRVDGGAPQPVGIDGTFTITGDGVHAWTVDNELGAVASGIVRIDASGPPTITLGVPADGGVYPIGTTIDVRCTDPSLRTCDINVNGAPAQNGDPLPNSAGPHTIAVAASDALGLASTVEATFRVTGPTTIGSITGPLNPQSITETVVVAATFDDPDGLIDSYSATFEWGDGTSSIATSITAPTSGVNGLAVGEHLYAANGIYSVTVTISDGVGEVSKTFDFVVVYDAAAGQVNGAGKYLSGAEALVGGPPSDETAKFAFNAQYEDGETEPSGKTKLKIGKKVFDFKSTSYDYLVLGDTLATASGVGKVNGLAGYRFTVQAVDQGSTDYFRIVIWNDATGETVYDNGTLFAIGDQVTSGGGVKIKQ